MSDVVPVAPIAVGFTDATDATPATPEPIAAAPSPKVEPPDAEATTAPPGTPPADPPKAEPSQPDDRAAVRIAARASYEARQTRAAFAKIQAELTEAKAQGAKTAELQAELDAIKKDPARLLTMGLEANDIISRLLAPEPDEEIDPRLAATQAEVKALKDRLDADADAKKKDDEAQQSKAYQEQVAAADANIVKAIEAHADNYALTTPDDAATIRENIMAFCVAEKWEPSDSELADLVKQGIEQIHEQRMARRQKEDQALERVAKKAAPADQPQQKARVYTGVGFTDDDGRAAPPSPAKHTPAPATINPGLPSKRPYEPIGFTD